MVSIYDWYIMGGCVFLLVLYILLTFIDREDTK
jgi:hypothetical protein